MTSRFELFRASGRDVPDIGAETGNSLDDGRPGRVYSDAVGPVGVIYRTGDDWNVLAAAAEITTPDLSEAERWLWEHWSRWEFDG